MRRPRHAIRVLTLYLFVLAGIALASASEAQTDYDHRVFVVDLGSYLKDLQRVHGDLRKMNRRAKFSDPVQTEQVIADIMIGRNDTSQATSVFLVSNYTRPVRIDAKKIASGISDVRESALRAQNRYKANPDETPAASPVELVESLDKLLLDALQSARARGVTAPKLHMVWIGRRWNQSYVDASGSIRKKDEDSSTVIYSDACLGTPQARQILDASRISDDWSVEFEMHLVGDPDQAAPQELSVRSLIHRMLHFSYASPAVGQPYVSNSKVTYHGTFMPGCSLEPRLDTPVPSYELGQDDQSGICTPITRPPAASDKYIVRCDEFDASFASVSWRNKQGLIGSGTSAKIIAANHQGTTIAQGKVDLLFSAKGYGRSLLSEGGLGSWIDTLPDLTKVHVRVRIDTTIICPGLDELYIEFEVGDTRLDPRGRFFALVSSLPDCNSHTAKFVTVPLGVLVVS